MDIVIITSDWDHCTQRWAVIVWDIVTIIGVIVYTKECACPLMNKKKFWIANLYLKTLTFVSIKVTLGKGSVYSLNTIIISALCEFIVFFFPLQISSSVFSLPSFLFQGAETCVMARCSHWSSLMMWMMWRHWWIWQRKISLTWYPI